MQKELSNIFTQILPEDSSLQAILYADKNIGGILERYVRARANATEVMQALAYRRAEYLSKLAVKSHLFPYILRNFRCFMNVCLNLNEPLNIAMERAQKIANNDFR